VWRIPERYGFESGKQGYICNVYTVPEARRRGISTQMLIELIKKAKLLLASYPFFSFIRKKCKIY
jgi:GNAT superfamily N-acetyltransferase